MFLNFIIHFLSKIFLTNLFANDFFYAVNLKKNCEEYKNKELHYLL